MMKHQIKQFDFIKKIQRHLDRFLQGTYEHFSCRLPKKITELRTLFYKLLFFKIELSQNQVNTIQNFPKDAYIVYVNKFKSKFEVLYSYSRFSSFGIPAPNIALDYRFLLPQRLKQIFRIAYVKIHHLLTRRSAPNPFNDGYLERRFTQGDGIFISLVERREFYQRYIRQKSDPLQYLIDLQMRIDRPIFIVPQLFFYTRSPSYSVLKISDIIFGSNQRPGMIKKLYKALLTPDRMFVELSQPLNLKDFVDHHDGVLSNTAHLALILRRNLLSQITRHRQSVTGPVLKTHDEIKQSILTDDELQDYMKRHAKRRRMSLYRTRKEALEYFDEIAARYRPGFVSLSVRLIQWLSNTIFEGIHVDALGFNKIKDMALKGPVVFVPCHRSHIDTLVMLSITVSNYISPPHIFAGKNLSFWPLGTILRMAGVFFVRRSFKGAVFYTKVFSAYINKLLEEGYNINVFIEGTRSRSGKLLQPQLGMLSLLLDAYKKGACRDLIFVPVYIGYDRVPEESEYLNEIRGGEKKKENAKQMLKFGSFLRKRFGKIYVKYAEPIAINDFIRQMGFTGSEISTKEKNLACAQLGKKIMNDIDQAAMVTPQSLVAGALLNSQKAIRTFEHLMAQVETYLTFLLFKNVDLSESLTMFPKGAVAHILDQYAQAKIIETVQTEKGVWQDNDKFKVRKSRRPVLEYYKNNCIIHFIPAAFTALSILSRDAFQFNSTDLVPDYSFLEELFGFEFTRDPETLPANSIRKSIKAFIDDAVLVPHPTLPDTYNITSPGHRKLKQFAVFLTPFFESYWVVLKWISQKSKKKTAPKDRLKKIIDFGNQQHKNRVIEQRESLSTLNYENALRYFTKNGIRGGKNIDKIQAYEKHMARYMGWLNK